MKDIYKYLSQTACALLILACGLAPFSGAFGQQNIDVTDDVISGTDRYTARDTINAVNKVGTDNANDNLQNETKLILKAGERIFLKQGFHAKANSRLEADIYDFFATDNLSDEHIDLHWSIETQCLLDSLEADPLKPSDLHGDLVYVEITDENDHEIFHRILTDTDLNVPRIHDVLHSHPVEDNHTATYRMRLYAIGSGYPLCQGTYEDEGTTLPFQPLTEVNAQEGEHPGEIVLSWINNSDLPTHYRIYRDDPNDQKDALLIDVINGKSGKDTLTYTDSYNASDPNTLVNGIQYQYCIEVYNERLQKAYGKEEACANGSTIALTLAATKDDYADKVELTWVDASTYADELAITRDGETIATLTDKTATTYTDMAPIYGKAHEYGLVLKKDGQTVVAAFDEGSIAPNGLLAGRIVTDQGDYALEGVAVQATATIEGQEITLDAVANHAGYFEFAGVYYHDEATYTLTTTLQGHTFVQHTQEIDLSREAPQAIGIEFKGNHLFAVDEDADFIFDNLSVQPQPTLDYMALNWSYTKLNALSSKTVYFRVYRDGQRIAFLDDSQGNVTAYNDATGIPGTAYTYEVKAYIKLNADNVVELAQIGQETYPDMAKPTEFAASANDDLGVIDLSWTHDSDNIDGFELLRDNTPIASLSPDETTYTDYTGIPGQDHTYGIYTRVKKEGQLYRSDTATSDEKTYPDLNTVTLADNNFTPNLDGTLTFAFAEAHDDDNDPNNTNNYNFDGYRVYRNDVLIHTIYKGFPREYTDYTGSGGKSYKYEVKAFLENSHIITEGAATGHTTNYPAVPAPINMAATDNTDEGYVTLTWNYTSAYANGFVVYRDQDSVTTLPPVARVYRDNIDLDDDKNEVFDYEIKAFTLRNGQRRYSSAADDTGKPKNTTSQDNDVPMPESFTASRDLHNQVRLQWDYPDYVLAKFIVYRDDVELATLDTDQRLYYDYTAAQGVAYVYSIVADYENPQDSNDQLQSQKAFAEGSITSLHTISGVVTSEDIGYGLAGVALQARMNSDTIGYAITDASGFYRFAQVPEGDITLNIQSPYTNTIVNANNGQAIVQVNNTQEDYRQDFVSSLGYEKPADTVAVPVLKALPNALDATVEVRWTTRSANYSGFKVYRGLNELADVKAHEEMLVIDSLGYPGQGYSYRIQAYWTDPQGIDSESGFVYEYVEFPTIAPVRSLEVTRFAARDYVEVTWSHPYDQYTYYEVNRNDQFLGIVNTGNPLVLKDTTGLPGHRYVYTVTAVEVRDDQVMRSTPVSKSVYFPDVAMPADIIADVPDGKNHVNLTWNYPSQLFDGFRIYRDGEWIADTVVNTPYPQNATYHYRDSLGIPGLDHTYEVRGYVHKEGTLHESAPDLITTTFPALAPVADLEATPNADKGTLTLSWNYPAKAENGYIVKRGDEQLVILTDPTNTSYVDISGIPNHSYTYYVTARAERGANKAEYLSTAVNVSETFPQVATPTGLAASDGTDANAITITWEYVSHINDGFKLYRGNDEIADLPGGRRTYTDVLDVQAAHTYKVRAYRTVNDQYYESPDSNTDEGSNKYDQVGTNSETAATNVQATDGTLANKVRITWNYAGNNPDGFGIYRDGALIDNVAGNGRVYNDLDATPGKEHLYQVVAVSGQDESRRQADTGYRPSNGTIQGTVITLANGAGVPNVSIYAFAWIDSERHDYRTTTDAAGNYELDQVFYGANGVDYTVVATLSGHDFVEDTLATSLEAQITTGYVDPFTDKTAYILRGNVTYQGSACTLKDSTRVMLHIRKNNNTETDLIIEEEAYTDGGAYAFVINPNDPNVLDYTLSMANEQLHGTAESTETTWHTFGTDALSAEQTGRKVVLEKTDFAGTTTWQEDFVDTTVYEVELAVQSTCGPIGANEFDVRISSTDGCYEQQERTLDNGKITVNLPPLSYTLHVSGVENASPETLPVVDYLRVRPATLDLFALHNEVLEGTPKDTSVVFTYHTAPQIAVSVDDLNDNEITYLCGDPAEPMVIEQGLSYALSLQVEEAHGDESCFVNEGFLVIKNAAAEDTAPDTLMYNAGIGSFSPYAFIGGDPITVAPYTLAMVVEYHTENGGYQGEKVQRIIVEGSKSPPGKDIIVIPSLENDGQIQLPLFILRDPPGDQSYSYIEKGMTFKKTVSASTNRSLKGGWKQDIYSQISSLGKFYENSVIVGATFNQSGSFDISITTKERIETSSDATLTNNYIVGDKGDIIVGAGLSTAYGITEEIKVDKDKCEITKSTKIELIENGLKTTWHYSVFQIKKLIEEYKQQLEKLSSGAEDQLTIEGDLTINGEQKTSEEYIGTLIKNWNKILKYHRRETVPMCQVCDLDNLPQVFREAVIDEEIYKNFCKNLESSDGTNHCDSTKLATFEWSEKLIYDYNELNQFKAKLNEYIETMAAPVIILGPITQVAARFIINDIIKGSYSEVDEEYSNLFGPEVQNITFDGASGAINQEVAVTKSEMRQFSQNYFVETENFWGALTQVKIEIAKGVGVSTTNNPIVENNNKGGYVFNYNFNINVVKENSEENSATVGYVLDDDDDGDQFSVTVVKGIDPSHTPYFSLLGGRSSCPAEPGTISRFDPQLFVELPDGSVTKEATLWDVDPNGPASFRLKMASGNLFDENLLYHLHVPTEYSDFVPNQHDAEIDLKTDGVSAGTSMRFIAPGTPEYTQVDIYRRAGDVYDYEDIVLALAPKCEETYNSVVDYVHLKVHFKRPCSPVSLVVDGNMNQHGSGSTDGNGWIVNKAPDDVREKLLIKLVDYDPYNELLSDITLQYRRKGTDNWTDILDNGTVGNGIDGDDSPSVLTRDTLAAYFEEHQKTYPNPTYNYLWDITGNDDLIDGEYEIRARSLCEGADENYSNILKGVIDRTSMQVVGLPEPADGILSLGDEISVTFNEIIDCALFNDDNVTLVNASNNDSEVDFTVTCVDNRLVLVVTDDLSLLEGDTLVATVSSVVDRYDNDLESSVSWSFAVHHNPVYWYPNSLSVQVFRGETATLTSLLHNTSDADLGFALSGHELSWLSVSKAQGSVPSSGVEINFVVDATNLSVGNYQDTIQASVTGFTDEALIINVEVLPQGPDWSVDYNLYEDNMAIAANFDFLDDPEDPDDNDIEPSEDTKDMISVWIDNSIRGVANISKVTDNDYVAYLTVAGNAEDAGEELSFRVWDASTGTEYDGHPGQVYTYSKDAYYGTTANPVILTVNSNADSARYVPLKAGWNWISFNTVPGNNDLSIGNILKSLDATEGDLIKTQTATSTYSVQNGWESLNDELVDVDTVSGYHLYLAEGGMLRLTGRDAGIASKALIAGWNLVGYPPQQAQSPDAALTFSATDGDVIKTAHGFAEYSDDPAHIGWFGLDKMRPNKAYMINVSTPKALQYSGRNEGGESMAIYAGDWSVDPALFEYNMTMLGTLDFEGINPEGMSILAFVGEEPRGIGRWQYHEATDKYLVSLFVYANTDGEEIYFKLVDEATGDLYELANTTTFKTNDRIAGIDDPYVFTTDLSGGNATVQVVPNPFVDKAVIRYTVPGDDIPVTIRVYDLGGMLVTELMKDELHQAGWHETTLSAGQFLKPGMYVCKLQIGEEVVTRKVVLQK